jgi:hypothetical protein
VIDWTATLRGVSIGAGTTSYRWATMPTGVLGYTDVRTGDVPIPRADGVFAGDDRLGGRTMTFDVHIIGTTDTAAETAAAALAGAFAPSTTDLPIDVRLTGTPAEYRLFGRPRGCDIALDTKFLSGVLRARCTFLATDPRRFGAEVSATLALPSGASGLLFPAVAPFVFGAGAGGNVSISQAGAVDADWTATISGPITTPTIEHVELGRSLAFDLELLAGETLVIDSRTRSALLNGTASRYSSLTSSSRWFQIPPGTSTVRLTGASGSGSAQFTYRPAYL